MKKILLCWMILMSLSTISKSFGMASAQVCKINGSNDSVEVFNCFLAEDNAVVTLSNDSKDINANVTITIEVKYSSTINKSYTGKIMASPGSTELKIPIEAKINGHKPQSIKVTSISGTRATASKFGIKKHLL